MISRVFSVANPLAALLYLAVAFFLGATHLARAQDGMNEEKAISGNNATIVVNVRTSAGDPLPVAAVVKLFRNGSIPNGQATTAQGRAIFMPQNLGGFTVEVEASGYKPGRENVDVPIPVRVEVDVYMQPESDTANSSVAPGKPVLTPKAKAALNKALEALSSNKLDEAEKRLSEASKLAPSHPDVLYLEGVLYLRKEEWAKAQSVLEKATQLDPNHGRAQGALGTALCDQGKFEQAIAPLELSLQLNAGSWETRWTLAKAYYYDKHYDEALKASQQALADSSGKAPEIQLLVAQALTAVGQYEESAKVLRGFLKEHSDNPQAKVAQRWLDRLNRAGKISNP